MKWLLLLGVLLIVIVCTIETGSESHTISTEPKLPTINTNGILDIDTGTNGLSLSPAKIYIDGAIPDSYCLVPIKITNNGTKECTIKIEPKMPPYTYNGLTPWAKGFSGIEYLLRGKERLEFKFLLSTADMQYGKNYEMWIAVIRQPSNNGSMNIALELCSRVIILLKKTYD